MGCLIACHNDAINYRFKFNSESHKQSLLIDMILRYSEKDMPELANALDITVERLQNIYDGVEFLPENDADDLALLFLIFFGQKICSQFSLTRNYAA